VPWHDSQSVVRIAGFDLSYHNAPVVGEPQTLAVKTLLANDGKTALVQFNLRPATFSSIRIWPKGTELPMRQVNPVAPNPIHVSRTLLRQNHDPDYTGVWVESLRSAADPVICMSERVNAQVVNATAGRLGKLEQIVPWEEKSCRLTFSGKQSDDYQVLAAELFLNLNALPKARTLRFWVYAHGTGKEGKNDTLTLFAGGAHTMGAVNLHYNLWHCIDLDLTELFPPARRPWPYLTIWAHPQNGPLRHGNDLHLEFNGCVAIGALTPAGTPVSDNLITKRLPVSRQAPATRRVILLAEPGKAVWQQLTFPEPVLVSNVTATNADIAWQYHNAGRSLRLQLTAVAQNAGDLNNWFRLLDSREYSLCANGQAVPIGVTITLAGEDL